MHLIPILSLIGTVGMLVRSFPANMSVPQAVRSRYEMDCNGDNVMTDGCFRHYGYNCSTHTGHLGIACTTLSVANGVIVWLLSASVLPGGAVPKALCSHLIVLLSRSSFNNFF